MSIARAGRRVSRSFRTLMLLGMMRLLSIKDLKDLSFLSRGDYRHAGPKGPEEIFSRVRSRGTGPRTTMKKTPTPSRRARACPSPCLGRGNDLGWRAVFAQIERSRGTGPRATGQEGDLVTVGRWENLSLAMCLAGRPPHLYRAGALAPDLFGCRRARTTRLECAPPVPL